MSFKEEVIELLKDTAAKIFKIEASSLSVNTNFLQDLKCKSTDLVRFTTTLEDEYDVEVPFMAFKRCATFADAAAYIADLVGVE